MDIDVTTPIENTDAFKMLMWVCMDYPDNMMSDDYRRLLHHMEQKNEFEIVHLLGILDYVMDKPVKGDELRLLIGTLEVMVSTIAKQYNYPFMNVVREFASRRQELRDQINVVLEKNEEVPDSTARKAKIDHFTVLTKQAISKALGAMGIDADEIFREIESAYSDQSVPSDLQGWGAKVDKNKLN